MRPATPASEDGGPARPRPPAETRLDLALVQALLAAQHPDLAGLGLVHAGGGWDNEVYRVGPGLAVRLPRRAAAVPLLEHERDWLPRLAPALPLPVPVPVRRGEPGEGYPWPWSVVRWLPGRSAAVEPPLDADRTARLLARFVARLGRPAPPDAPRSPVRGVPLSARDEALRQRLGRLPPGVPPDAVLREWERSLAAPSWQGPAVWLHGDLHPGNLVVRAGRLAGVLDFGDLTAGDPATDLSVAWVALPAEHRRTFRDVVGGFDEATWARARGNALAHGVACLAGGGGDPMITAIGARTVARVLGDPEPAAQTTR